MEDYIVSLVLWGVIFWTTLFLIIRNFFRKRSFDFCNRATSTIHAIMALSLASLSVQDWTCPVCPLPSAASSPSQKKALAVTLSYLIYDTVCTILGKRCTVDNAVHHLVSITGIGAGLAYEKCGTILVATLVITEISSPFLHMREILKEFGIKDTDLNLLVDILFAVTFSSARMVAGPYVTYVTLTTNNPFLIKATALGLQLVSTFWFYKIVKMVRYKLARRKTTPTKSMKIN